MPEQNKNPALAYGTAGIAATASGVGAYMVISKATEAELANPAMIGTSLGLATPFIVLPVLLSGGGMYAAGNTNAGQIPDAISLAGSPVGLALSPISSFVSPADEPLLASKALGPVGDLMLGLAGDPREVIAAGLGFMVLGSDWSDAARRYELFISNSISSSILQNAASPDDYQYVGGGTNIFGSEGHFLSYDDPFPNGGYSAPGTGDLDSGNSGQEALTSGQDKSEMPADPTSGTTSDPITIQPIDPTQTNPVEPVQTTPIDPTQDPTDPTLSPPPPPPPPPPPDPDGDGD